MRQYENKNDDMFNKIGSSIIIIIIIIEEQTKIRWEIRSSFSNSTFLILNIFVFFFESVAHVLCLIPHGYEWNGFVRGEQKTK